MQMFRLWMSHLFLPLSRLWVLLTTKLLRYSRLRVGTLSVLGPPAFIALCKPSIERFRSLDPDLHRCLTEREEVCIYYDPKRLDQALFPRLFSVNDAFVAWSSDGIIARFAYIAFAISAFPRGVISAEGAAAAKAKEYSVRAETKAWLENHGFPATLSGSFASPAY